VLDGRAIACEARPRRCCASCSPRAAPGPARADAKAIAGSQDPPVWRALFDYTFEWGGAYRQYRAGHGMDLFFGFHNFGTVPASDGDLAFSDLMVGVWTRFAATGDPNGPGLPRWPEYDETRDETFVLSAEPYSLDGVWRPQCRFWDAYYGR
jgi:carboxylesterase type B